MIEANELRLGNYLTDNYNVERKIVAISENDISLDEKNHKKGLDFVKPIPLTEEWLLKFGFDKHHEGYYIDHKDLNASIYLWHENDFWHMSHFKNKFQFVHHLQNIFHALTGEELTIKSPEIINS